MKFAVTDAKDINFLYILIERGNIISIIYLFYRSFYLSMPISHVILSTFVLQTNGDFPDKTQIIISILKFKYNK